MSSWPGRLIGSAAAARPCRISVGNPRCRGRSVPAPTGLDTTTPAGGKRQFRAYHDRVFERFWRRELDIEDAEAIASVLSEVHADRTGFRGYLTGAGRIEHDSVRESAEAAGVFGVPSLIVEGELFWGREHLASIKEKLATLRRGNTVRAAPSC
jgi:2-hydroxychromene-2-carboxylate isomerase